MKKWTVYHLTPQTTWEGVEANSAKEAIAKCEPTFWDEEANSMQAREEETEE